MVRKVEFYVKDKGLWKEFLSPLKFLKYLRKPLDMQER